MTTDRFLSPPRAPARPTLFDPIELGRITLRNRIVMAPMTRSRAGAGDAPGPMNATYYAQRASAGLIVTEGAQISPQGKGYPFTPGIYSDAQIAGWKQVTDAVHREGGRIFVQLAHVGRIGHPDLLPDGARPVAPSPIRPDGDAYTPTGPQPYPVPRALETAELPAIVDQYVLAARAALQAGFDGVEIHAGNGYLLDQFLRDGTNRRTDDYGGTIDNRLRLPLEVVRAVSLVSGPDRLGIRISPVTPHFGGISDSDPQALFERFAHRLSDLAVYLHVVEGIPQVAPDAMPAFDYDALRHAFGGHYIANNGYTKTRADTALSDGHADLVSFGYPFIANPDFAERLRHDRPLAHADMSMAYGGGEAGYTDYPPFSA
ncbi:alkene reductase [Burkholderia lata]|uniref:12-oxophytodienoate reductase n=1 Tax=Burkholderia lata (strain ATCC 17760 / DSM 23089 / LMG 22485 / NCIMB 9086 / R18194 / 383) TaxID=482957 RepID=A0A6P2U5G2_BURL3|nr:alkene reductase [Burkholderia lata]VWC67339.1 12-oxophytodienoate reductase [Burkholderia lata]